MALGKGRRRRRVGAACNDEKEYSAYSVVRLQRPGEGTNNAVPLTPTTPPEVEPEVQNTESLGRRLSDDAGASESELRKKRPLIWWVTLVGPFALTLLLLALLFLAYGESYVRQLVITAVVTFFALGKFVILGGEEAGMSQIPDFLTREQLFLLVVFLDLMTATILVFHMGVLFKIRGLGKRLLNLVEDGQFILANRPWMKRMTFLGTVAFVMFPLAATGSVGGSIFGRLLGMKRRSAFLAIAIGSVLGCGLMYFGAGLINRYLDRKSPSVMIGGILVIILVMVILNLRYRRLRARHKAELDQRLGSGPPGP